MKLFTKLFKKNAVEATTTKERPIMPLEMYIVEYIECFNSVRYEFDNSTMASVDVANKTIQPFYIQGETFIGLPEHRTSYNTYEELEYLLDNLRHMRIA